MGGSGADRNGVLLRVETLGHQEVGCLRRRAPYLGAAWAAEGPAGRDTGTEDDPGLSFQPRTPLMWLVRSCAFIEQRERTSLAKGRLCPGGELWASLVEETQADGGFGPGLGGRGWFRVYGVHCVLRVCPRLRTGGSLWAPVSSTPVPPAQGRTQSGGLS